MGEAINKRIETLETKLKQAKALKQKKDAQKRVQASKVERQKETRRKILVGAAILSKVERGDWPKDKLLAMMDSTLTRQDDRTLFDLPALPEKETEKNTTSTNK